MSRIRISLEGAGGKPSAVHIEVTPDMLRLAKKGAKMTGASVDQVLVWTFMEAVASMGSWITGGTLEENGHEPHLIQPVERTLVVSSRERRAA